MEIALHTNCCVKVGKHTITITGDTSDEIQAILMAIDKGLPVPPVAPEETHRDFSIPLTLRQCQVLKSLGEMGLEEIFGRPRAQRVLSEWDIDYSEVIDALDTVRRKMTWATVSTE